MSFRINAPLCRFSFSNSVNGKTYFRLAWEHRHALSLFGTAPRARVRPNHSSPINPVRHQHQMFIATECIPFPISGSRCRGAFLFLFQAIDAGHLVYITVNGKTRPNPASHFSAQPSAHLSTNRPSVSQLTAVNPLAAVNP